MKTKKLTKMVISSGVLAGVLFPSTLLPVMADTTDTTTSSNPAMAVGAPSNNSPAEVNPAASSSGTNNGHAAQYRELQKSYIVFGSGLSQSERQQVGNVLVGNSNPQNFTDLVADAADYNEFLNNNQPSDATNAAMISSVAIEPADPHSGINVTIKDFNGANNITQVTAKQYALAAQMAGVTDINIVVTANRPVSGTSALTGVYEALSTDGTKLNNQNTTAANSVLAATQNTGAGLNPSQKGSLVQATGETAQQIVKDNNNNNPDNPSDIAKILKRNLNRYDINLSNAKLNVLVNSLNTFKGTPAAHTNTVENGLTNTIHNIRDTNSNNEMINPTDWRAAHQGWFTRMINWIKEFFSKMFHPNQFKDVNKSSDNDAASLRDNMNSNGSSAVNNSANSSSAGSSTDNQQSDSSSVTDTSVNSTHHTDATNATNNTVTASSQQASTK